MFFKSTRGAETRVSLAQALRLGLANDGGLFIPEEVQPLPETFFERLSGSELKTTASYLAEHLLGGDFVPSSLQRIVCETFDFPIPLVQIEEQVWALELFHGPTLAFKDVGARFLARLLAETAGAREQGVREQVTVIVATSGDTGGAVAQAFFGVEGTRVAILYPQGQVSPVQERQFTTLGGNVKAFAVDGTFDDCQSLVKQVFADRTLHREIGLTSANSINVGRLLPQIFYYFQALAQASASGLSKGPLLFSVPSGNFGNLTAGLMAKAMGLEARFLAATNLNAVVPEYLATGVFAPRPSLRTVSNAMDVGSPSNFSRIQQLYGSDLERLRQDLRGYWVDDETTRRAIRQVHDSTGYLMDPHTAVGYQALTQALQQEPADTQGVVLATAHPAKFREVVEPVIERKIPLPPALAARLHDPVQSVPLANNIGDLKNRLSDWAEAT